MPIHVACDNCGKRYKLKDERSNSRVKCKICGAAIKVPNLPEGVAELRVNESGAPSLIHESRQRDFELAFGDSECIDKISEHITTHIGPVAMVFHELISDLVHIDIHQVAPTDERPYWTLVTSGMSDLPMTVPDGCDDLKYAELMIGLPPEWPMDQKAWSDESHYWPIRWLKLLARLPHEYKTWLGFGHTIPNGDPPEPFADDVDFCCALVVPPVAVPEEFRELVINEEKTIHFYAFVPLYREETIFKLKKGADPLLDRFDAKGVNEIFNPNRANVCKKKFGLF